MASGDVVKLDVGGTIFKTTKSTLTKFDGFFKAMFESEIPLNTDESGCIFIDRDATYFNVILNFLRDGTVPVPDDNYRKEQILKEAQFYMLDGLIHLCGGETSEEWKRVNLLSKIRMTADAEEHEKFRCEHYSEKNKEDIVISYNVEKYGDISKCPAFVNFVSKHGDKWNIMIYIGQFALIGRIYSKGIEKRVFVPPSVYPYTAKSEVNAFFNDMERYVCYSWRYSWLSDK